jgi:uncharacterized iron-regulated protein
MKMILQIGSLLLLTAGFLATAAEAEEYAVPNQGSPYRSLGELKEGEILHLPTGLTVSVEQMIDTVSGSRVIYVGETHDNLEAHRVQLEIIRRLQERFPGQISVGMEMFRRSAQDDLDRWHLGNLADKQFRKLFKKNWGGGYGLYQPIFEYLKENSIPLIGLKSSRAMEQKFRDGGPDQAGLPEIDAGDKYHRAYSMSLFGGNDTHTRAVSKPYQMLLLWEESMAETVANFLKDEANKNRKLVVLAGGFHVQYGYGIPKRAFRRVPHAYSIILPAITEIPKELKNREMKMKSNVSIPLIASDFSWKVSYIVPPPNRIKLGVFLEELENGLKVLKVEKGSNAERMNLQKDDVLLALDGNELTDVEDLAAQLQKHNFGDTVHLKIVRGGSEQEISGVLQETPKTE